MNAETPTTALARIVQPLEQSKAAIVAAGFSAMFTRVEGWQTEAAALVVTDASEVRKMKQARLLRLEIKEARIGLEKRRKEMKAGILLEGKAIDGAFAVFESFAAPIEAMLLEQEQFAKRIEDAKREQLRGARVEALMAIGVETVAMPAALGEMSEEAWLVVLDDAKAAREAKLEAARQEEEVRVEAARLVAERAAIDKAAAAEREATRRAKAEAQREENERLKLEAVALAEVARIEREAAEAKALELTAKIEAERERNRAEREAADIYAATGAAKERAAREAEADKLRAALAAAEADRKAAEAKEEARAAAERDAHKPTKAKYGRMVMALRHIAEGMAEPREVAREALEAVGEVPHA